MKNVSRPLPSGTGNPLPFTVLAAGCVVFLCLLLTVGGRSSATASPDRVLESPYSTVAFAATPTEPGRHLPESSSAVALMFGAVQLVAALALFLIGRWGYARAESLPPAGLPEELRRKRVRSYSRGSIACQMVSVIFALTVVVTVVVRVLLTG